MAKAQDEKPQLTPAEMARQASGKDIDFFPTLSAHKTHDLSDQTKEGKPGIPANQPDSPYNGRYMWVGPVKDLEKEDKSNTFWEFEFTGAPGSASGLYFALVFQLPKWKWHVEKVDEWIEVNPTHREYYERTIATKGALEATIKEGLRSAAQAVADFELLKHDLRKYQEILNYFTNVEKAKAAPAKEREKKLLSAEHALRAMFVDQVDVHTGAAAMVQMAGTRWPTVISDFMNLTMEYETVDDIRNKLKMKKSEISGAEAVVLKTKNDLYREWLRTFGDHVRERYTRLNDLVTARQKSVEEYHEWLKPHIMRFKQLKPGMSYKRQFTSFFEIAGQATFTNKIKIWAWQPFKVYEISKGPIIKPKKELFAVEPLDDDFVVNQFIKSPDTGLASPNFYPWLLHKSEKVKGKTVADEIIADIKKKWADGEIDGCSPDEPYYLLIDFDIERLGLRLPTGELEDLKVVADMWVVSQNILLVKLVEIECRKRELDYYIAKMLGVSEGKKISEGEYPELFGAPVEKPKSGLEKFRAEWAGVTGSLTSPFKAAKGWLWKPRPWLTKYGPYENDFEDRITKLYILPAGRKIGDVLGLLLSKSGFE